MEEQRQISSVEEVKQKPHEAFHQLVRERDKSQVEFNRYKQDCRKRALDLAEIQMGKYSGTTWSDEKMLEQADKYYNWLISIPQ